MVGALRGGVAHGVGVVPHPLQVRHRAAHALHLLVQRAVGVRVRAHQHLRRRAAQLRGRPHAPHQLVVAADPARRDHHRLGGAQLSVLLSSLVAWHDRVAARAPAARPPILLQNPYAQHAALLVAEQLGYARAETHLQGRAPRVALDRAPHRFHQCLARAPREVEARDGVAVAEVAALGPVDDREETHADLPQPAAHVVARAADVLLGPAARPLLLGAELGDPQPIFQREALAVADPRAALLGGVHHEHPPERLARQAPQLAWLAAVEQQHRVAAAQQLQRAHQPREAGADDDRVGVAHVSAMPGATCTSTSSGSGEASARRSSTPSSSGSAAWRALMP